MSTPVYELIDSTGVIVPDTTEIQAEVQQEYINAFGSDLNVTAPNTPQGLLINVETLARVAVANNNATLANQINPNFAGGVFLDALMALTGSQRIPATFTRVFATITGVEGTVIPAGSEASSNGESFQTLQNVTIPIGGSITEILFQAVNSGAVPCDSSTLTQIVSPVIGWETVTNPDAAFLLGAPTQSDQQAKIYRTNTLALQGTAEAQAIISAILDVNQGAAKSVKFLENISPDTQTIDSVSMVGHSIYACVNPGDEPQGVGTYSTVVGTINGTNGTAIPAGSQASSNGNVFQTLVDVTIPISGTIDTTFQAMSTGAILCPPGTLIVIETPISGWDTVTNAAENVTTGLVSTIAEAMVATKSAGAAYNNGSGVNISAQIIVPFSNQQMTVLFDTPNIIEINVAVKATINTPVQDPETTIKNAILNYANGLLPGIPGLTVGQNVSSFEIAGAITSQYPGIYVSSCLISYNPDTPTASTELTINVFEIAVIEDGNIYITLV